MDNDPELDDEDAALPDALSSGVPVGPGGLPGATPQGRASEPEFYVAVLVNEMATPESDKAPLYEESFALITAGTAEEAREKAGQYGKQQATSYRDEHGELVTWSMKHVVEVKQVEDATFDDGTELYSRFFRDYESYCSFETTLSGEEL